MKIIIYVPL